MVASFLHLLLPPWLDSPPPLDASTKVVHGEKSSIHTLLCELSDDLLKGAHAACLAPFFKRRKQSPLSLRLMLCLSRQMIMSRSRAALYGLNHSSESIRRWRSTNSYWSCVRKSLMKPYKGHLLYIQSPNRHQKHSLNHRCPSYSLETFAERIQIHLET